MRCFGLFTGFVRALIVNQVALATENLALRQQLSVLRSKTGRARPNWSDRLFWVALSKLWSGWQRVLVFVKPATVIAWHRRLFKLYWTRKTRNKKRPGRPKVSKAIRQLIARMTRENRRPGMAVGRFRRHEVPRSPKDAEEEAKRNTTWGAPRIVKEMALLGVSPQNFVCVDTIVPISNGK